MIKSLNINYNDKKSKLCDFQDNYSNDEAQETAIELGTEEVIGYELYLYVKITFFIFL